MIIDRLRSGVYQLLSCTLGGLLAVTAHAQSPETALVEELHSHQETDQILARIPVTDAAIPAVVQARVEISLRKARLAAGRAACGGRWVASGPISVSRYHDSSDSAPIINRDEKYWYYRVLRKPQPFTCKNSSRAEYFLEMSRHLPEWVVIQPAGQQFAFHQGEPILPARISVIARAR